tara:strand:+ start:947 stop:1807 length:861 start_codon:yes stop_codon:yes gene_type:complete
MYDNPWIYRSQYFFGENIKGLEGFVYLIVNKSNNRKYIGKKSFWQRRKQKKSNRRKTTESNWKEYYGSSDLLKIDIEKYGKENFNRYILHLCKYKKGLAFYEQKEQWNRNVLLTDEYYNTNIAGKFFVTETEKIYEAKYKITTKNDQWKKIKSEQMKGDNNIAKRDDVRKKLSEKYYQGPLAGLKGKNHPRYGKKHNTHFKEKVSGEKHFSFDGYYVTPWGTFTSVYQAVNNGPKTIKYASLKNACENSDKKITKSHTQWGFFKENNIGKTFKEIGFSKTTTYYGS